MIDVDHFKDINDRYGHLAGDRVLVTVGKSIKEPLRPNDMVARYGGEEFSVLLPETTVDNAVAIAERLRVRVSQADPGTLQEHRLPKVTVSIGVAGFKAGGSLETLIAGADAAMFEAKQAGRNCVRVAVA